jgi:hypothetical protein
MRSRLATGKRIKPGYLIAVSLMLALFLAAGSTIIA